MNAFPAFIAELKTQIVVLQNAMKYHGKHKENSLKKHLGVASLTDCVDYDALLAYRAYLEEKYKRYLEGKKNE